jgi:hypothetical protein
MRRLAATSRRPRRRARAIVALAIVALALATTATLPLAVLAGPFDNIGRMPKLPRPVRPPSEPPDEVPNGNIFDSSGSDGYTMPPKKCEWDQHQAANGYDCVNYVCWPLCGKGYECVDGKCVTKSGPDCEWFERATWDGRCEKWMCWPPCPQNYDCVNVECVAKPQQQTVIVQRPDPPPTEVVVVEQPDPMPDPVPVEVEQPPPTTPTEPAEPEPCEPCAAGEFLILGIDPQDPERVLARAVDGATVLINAGVAGAVLTYDASMEGLRSAARLEKVLPLPAQYATPEGAVKEIVGKLPVGKQEQKTIGNVLTGGGAIKSPFKHRRRRRRLAATSGLSMASVRAALRRGECLCTPAAAESFYDAVANEGQCSCERLANEFASTVNSWQREAKRAWDKSGLGDRLPKVKWPPRRRRLLFSELSETERHHLAQFIDQGGMHLARKLLGGLDGFKPPSISIKPPTSIGDLIDPANIIPTAAAPIDQLLRAGASQACAGCPSITPGDIWNQLSSSGQDVVDGIVGAVVQVGEGVSDLSKDGQRELGNLYKKYVEPTIQGVVDEFIGCIDGAKKLIKDSSKLKAKGSDANANAQQCAQIGSSAIGAFVDKIERCDDAKRDQFNRDHPDASPGDEFGLEEYGELGGNVAASVITANPGPLIAWLRDQAVSQAIKIGSGAGPAACAVSQNLGEFITALFEQFLTCLGSVGQQCKPEFEFAGYTASAGILQIECELDLSKAPVVGGVAKSATGDGRMNSVPHFIPWIEVDLGGKKQSASMEKCAKALSVLSPSCPKPAEDALDKEKEIINAAYCGHLTGRQEGDDCMFVAFGKEVDCQKRVGEAVRSSAAAITKKGGKGAGDAADAVKASLEELIDDVKASAKSLPPAVKAKARAFGANAAAALDAYGAAMINQVASNIVSGKRPTEALATAEFRGMRVVGGTVSVQCSLLGKVFDGHVVPYLALDTRHGY